MTYLATSTVFGSNNTLFRIEDRRPVPDIRNLLLLCDKDKNNSRGNKQKQQHKSDDKISAIAGLLRWLGFAR